MCVGDENSKIDCVKSMCLSQIAAKGAYHFKVFKEDSKGKTTTHLKLLTEEERITELSEMLEGKNSGASARNHAIELLRKG